MKDRVELMKQFASLFHRKYEAFYCSDTQSVWVDDFGINFNLVSDREDASAFMTLVYEVGKMGYGVQFGGYSKDIPHKRYYAHIGDEWEYGATLIEAMVRAFIALHEEGGFRENSSE
jgi:hypothetical protein